MSTTYHVTAKRWDGGWELHIKDVGVTQVTTLAHAEETVRDYLATLNGTDEVSGEVVVTPELGGLEVEVAAARKAVAEASRLQVKAARRSRSAARQLREAGLSVTDTAAVLGVSRGRVSQLVSN